jgi:hypothetical protein
MIIALDYDRTYTADQELWNAFIKAARSRGHEVIILTWRTSAIDPEFERLYPKVNAIWCTDRGSKRAYAERLGVKVDIWIDDNPESIIG